MCSTAPLSTSEAKVSRLTVAVPEPSAPPPLTAAETVGPSLAPTTVTVVVAVSVAPSSSMTV